MRTMHTMAAAMASLALTLGLGACGGTQAENDAPQEVEEVQEADERQVLGEQTDEAQEIVLTNGLGADVEQIALRTSGDDAYGDGLIKGDDLLEAGEEARLFVEAPDSDGTYDIQVQLVAGSGDDDEAEFLEVPLADVQTMTLMQDDGVYYVDYTDAGGKSHTTKEAAEERKAAEDAAATAEEEAEADSAEEEAQQEGEAAVATEESAAQDQAAEEPAAEEPAYEEPVYEEPVYEEPAYEEPAYEEPAYEEPAYVEPAAPVAPQSEDVCAEDVVFRE